MSPRFTVMVASVGLSLAACQSSAPYAGPGYVAAVTGAAVAGAAANRAAGGCWADCVAGSHCNPTTGLCERTEVPQTAATGATAIAPLPATGKPPPATSATARRPASKPASASYPPGHSYDVPPASSGDAACDPPATSSSSAASCDMPDAGAPH